ncbi:MAG TPA: hypothetical protein VMU89_06880 [Thermomicrobiaceae bacterium]|nr:hypothetical protein [Thermomicrobiaceae bacterium]
MTAIGARRTDTGLGLFGALLVAEALACLFFAAAHLGHPLSLGFATVSEPRVLPATIVEALCGVALGLAGGALLAGRARALGYALAAQIFSVFGFLLGVVSTLRGGGGSDPVNNDFHRVMLPLFVLGILVVLAARRRQRQASAA